MKADNSDGEENWREERRGEERRGKRLYPLLCMMMVMVMAMVVISVDIHPFGEREKRVVLNTKNI